MLELIADKVDKIEERLVGFRREIHRKPELSGMEENTASFVAGVLEANGIKVRRNVGGHGVVGVLDSGRKGPVIALRADMDALPMNDQKDVDYSSSVPGVMHACGHDVHTSILMGTAMVLSGMGNELKGKVMFIFQPAEESTQGAEAMLKEGIFDSSLPDAIVALHCLPEMEVGQVGHRPGMMTAAADMVKIVVKGKSGHASKPHQTVDAVLVSSMVINAIHHIVSRRTDPLHPAVISIGTIKGGTAENIIADCVEMMGTVRTVDSGLRDKMPGLIEDVIKGITLTMGAKYEFDYSFGCPSVINDLALDDFVSKCAADVLGVEGVIRLEDSMMGSEDFSLFAEKIPGVLFRLGTGNSEKGINCHLHNSNFDVDEKCLSVGTKLMAWIAASFLSKE